jgi:hypothetical protein
MSPAKAGNSASVARSAPQVFDLVLQAVGRTLNGMVDSPSTAVVT